MTCRLLGLTFLAALGLGTTMPAFTPAHALAQAESRSFSFADSQAASDKAREEDEVYSSGQDALNEGEYDDAVKAFDSVIKMHGRKVDAAMYWKAYALKKAGNKTQAQAMLNDLRKGYPQSRWLGEAAKLEAEMKEGKVDVSGCDDEETKAIALQALMNSDSERAVPILEKVIHGNCSPKMKDRALFVLAQSSSDKAQQIL